MFKLYAQDVIGELSFGQEFHLQEGADVKLLPPMTSHIFLAKLCGFVPGLQLYITICERYVPGLRGLLKQRQSLAADVSRYVQAEVEKRRIDEAPKTYDDSESRANSLTSLVMAKDPESGEMLTMQELVRESLSFMAAGIHSTAASLGFLFALLLQNPEILEKAQDEVLHEVPMAASGS